MAYMKKKRTVLRININGRIMVDPAIHRRINPNYQVSTVKPKEDEEYFEMTDESGDDGCGCGGNSSSSDVAEKDNHTPSSDESKPKKKFKVVEDENGDHQIVEIKSDDEEEVLGPKEKLDSLAQRSKDDSFTDDELLIASPVVLGFAFSEKLWLEFTVSGIHSVEWNEGAYDSLVLPENHKSIVKSLVTSHKFSAAKNIDDVISGKGKGLVAVLHGPPGTGKTLTAEGIAELLKCPLYMVSAGELGTDPRVLERNLTDILDIAHAWGAVLLLDEADIFLERRSIHDIHRNALVSIFLRLLEYFQGILFLTTNRVETFDDAFQSRETPNLPSRPPPLQSSSPLLLPPFLLLLLTNPQIKANPSPSTHPTQESTSRSNTAN
jgi:ATPase family associated with various cellular activities (AAA)